MASFSNTTRPTPFGVYDSDLHFIEEADSIVLYVKRRLGDDVLSVELTSKQIWANFEEAALEYSKQINAHQAEVYMSNLMGLSIGQVNSFKKNAKGDYYFIDSDAGQTSDNITQAQKDSQPLTIQDVADPRFNLYNTRGQYHQGEIEAKAGNIAANPVLDKQLGPHGEEQRFPRETHDYLIRRAEPYASEAFVGGVSNSVRGYIELKTGVQDYNIYKDLIVPHEVGSEIKKLSLTAYDPNSSAEQLTIFNPEYKKDVLPTATTTKIKVNEVFHFSPQAAYRFFDTTSAINYLNNQFAFESFTPETVFYVLPVFEDLLRAGQLDISNRVRRSNYSYKLQGQDLRIFPRPTQDNPLNLFVKFSFPADPFKPNLPYDDQSIDGVSNISNIPFGNIKFSEINQMSRHWIRQYTLALCKETLGLTRSKFSSVPIPGSDLQMNGSELISQGREDRQRLAESLSETLDKLTYQKLLESDAAQSESMSQILKRIPVPNGRAIIIG